MEDIFVVKKHGPSKLHSLFGLGAKCLGTADQATKRGLWIGLIGPESQSVLN